MNYYDGIEKLAIYFSGSKYESEVIEAKKLLLLFLQNLQLL